MHLVTGTVRKDVGIYLTCTTTRWGWRDAFRRLRVLNVSTRVLYSSSMVGRRSCTGCNPDHTITSGIHRTFQKLVIFCCASPQVRLIPFPVPLCIVSKTTTRIININKGKVNNDDCTRSRTRATAESTDNGLMGRARSVIIKLEKYLDTMGGRLYSWTVQQWENFCISYLMSGWGGGADPKRKK